jgi:exonuclease III
MKIATYNINGINGRLAVLLRCLREAQPDVVCLQELKCESPVFRKKRFPMLDQAIWKGEKSWNGVAILSKDEIRELRTDLPGEDEMATLTQGQSLITSCGEFHGNRTYGDLYC